MDNTENQIKNAELEASILLNYALALSKASTSNDDQEKVVAIENNLRLWVKIESSLASAKNLLPESIKVNMIKLSKFVERMTLTKGIKMSKSDFDCLININIQISEGLLAAVQSSLAKEEAFLLLKCAIDLSSAREASNDSDLVSALENNMQLWLYIKTLAESKDSALPVETKSNLIKLADYVSSKTLEIGSNITNINEKTLDSMIMTNLQISEGLIANQKIA